MSVTSRIIRCGKREDPFARIDKKMLDDDRLSFKAKGILAYLIGKPNDWKLRIADLVNRSREGIDSVRAGLLELRRNGYAELVRLRDEAGKTTEWVWKVSDSPMFTPESGNPKVDKPTLSKNDPTKNDSLKSPDVANATRGVLLSKEDQLAIIKQRPKKFISAERFHDMMDREDWVFYEYRPNLYEELCATHFHLWNEFSQRWEPIRNLKATLQALNDRILRQ